MKKKQNAITEPPEDFDIDTPLTDEEFERGRFAYLVRQVRIETGLSQEVFAKRYNIPVASIRDWEQGRRMPDTAARNYLRVIAKLPNEIAAVMTEY